MTRLKQDVRPLYQVPKSSYLFVRSMERIHMLGLASPKLGCG